MNRTGPLRSGVEPSGSSPRARAQVFTTYLEMRSQRELRSKRCQDERFWISEATVRQWQVNQFLYRAVGDAWSWNDKRKWTARQWRHYVESPGLRTFCAYYGGAPAGYYELRRHEQDGVEIVYFGLLPGFIGQGFGGALLTSAIEEAWKISSPSRVWVHTCTHDHPAALANYKARGMQVYKVEPEVAPAMPRAGCL